MKQDLNRRIRTAFKSKERNKKKTKKKKTAAKLETREIKIVQSRQNASHKETEVKL